MKRLPIEEIIKLTEKQELLVKEMTGIYRQMQENDIALAVNDNGEVVAYNAKNIDDCEAAGAFGEEPEGYEYADTANMTTLFPIWNCEQLLLKRK